jgi:hypothetical protein
MHWVPALFPRCMRQPRYVLHVGAPKRVSGPSTCKVIIVLTCTGDDQTANLLLAPTRCGSGLLLDALP